MFSQWYELDKYRKTNLSWNVLKGLFGPQQTQHGWSLTVSFSGEETHIIVTETVSNSGRKKRLSGAPVAFVEKETTWGFSICPTPCLNYVLTHCSFKTHPVRTLHCNMQDGRRVNSTSRSSPDPPLTLGPSLSALLVCLGCQCALAMFVKSNQTKDHIPPLCDISGHSCVQVYTNCSTPCSLRSCLKPH